MPLKVSLYNTYTRAIEELKPIRPSEVGVYCCGPTVYNFQHIGNFKTYVFEDVLIRALRFAGYTVKHVMNITDVGHLVSDADEGEDKMVVAMRREKKRSHEIADFYTQKFFEDWDKLNLIRPNIVCKATDHIQEMVELIKRLEVRGFTYVSGGNVYFDVSKFPSYGKLAKHDFSKLKTVARVDADTNKKNPFDFVLWFTKSKFENQELQWDSPWGRGYPGWHIECSAMSMKYLGEQFDIHCGGIDHVPVHHTNEIAQSEAAIGKHWVSIWMHSDFILVNLEKMSKSKGSFIVLDDLIAQGFAPEVYRFFCLSGHYRSQLNFSHEALESSANSVKRLKNSILSLREESKEDGKFDPSYRDRFSAAILNDINTPQAIAVLWEVLADEKVSASTKLATLYHLDTVLGLGFDKWSESPIPKEVEALVNARQQARESKNWKDSDRIRDEIRALGYIVEDSGGIQKVKRA